MTVCSGMTPYSEVPFTIRPARVDDAEAIATVHVRSWQEAYAGIVPQHYLDSLDLTRRIEGWKRGLSNPADARIRLVADLREQGVQGFAVVGPSRDDVFPAASGWGEIEAIYLRKAFHGTGIGRALFERSLRALAQRGFSKAAVWVLAANPTRTFYEAAGGRLVSSLAGSKEIEVGGVMLSEVSYEWDLIRNL